MKHLKPGGKILIVSFHSIEDKTVKYFLVTFQKIGLGRLDTFQIIMISQHFLNIEKGYKAKKRGD